MIRRRGYSVAMTALAVAGAAAAVSIWVARPPQFTLSLRPVRALTTAALQCHLLSQPLALLALGRPP
jgi:hypothetical protein